MSRLILAESAKRQLEKIGNYTEQNFGKDQKRKYLEILSIGMAELRENPGIGKSRDNVAPGYRSLQKGSHHIYYRHIPEAVIILHILHVRQNPELHIDADENTVADALAWLAALETKE